MTTIFRFNDTVQLELEQLWWVWVTTHTGETSVSSESGVITITFNGTESATIKHEKDGSGVFFKLEYHRVKRILDTIVAYAKDKGRYLVNPRRA